MDGPSGDVVLRFELADHIPEDWFFQFIPGVHLHTDRNLVAVQPGFTKDGYCLKKLTKNRHYVAASTFLFIQLSNIRFCLIGKVVEIFTFCAIIIIDFISILKDGDLDGNIRSQTN